MISFYDDFTMYKAAIPLDIWNAWIYNDCTTEKALC
jgi:hypothetical protein